MSMGRACREFGWPHRGEPGWLGTMIDDRELDGSTTRRPCARSATSRSRPTRWSGPTPSTGPSRSCATWSAGGSEYSRRTLLVAHDGRAHRRHRRPRSAPPRQPPPRRPRGARPSRGPATGDRPRAARRGRATWTRGRADDVPRRGLPADRETPSSGTAFARRAGLRRRASARTTRSLDLPVAPTARPTGYEVLTWTNRAPDDLVRRTRGCAPRCCTTCPAGEVDWEPGCSTARHLREEEQRVGRAYDHVVAVVRRTSDGELGGYSQGASSPRRSTSSCRTTRW